MEERHLIKGVKQWRSISELGGFQTWTFALSAYFSFQVGPSPQTFQVSCSGLQLHSYWGPESGVAALKANLWGTAKLLILTFFPGLKWVGCGDYIYLDCYSSKVV